jgi:hypothetical protein
MPLKSSYLLPMRFPAFISGSAWTLSIVLSIGVFLAPALWNGFAIIFFDTGGYVGRVLDLTLAPGRSLFYGLFLWAASLGWWTFWGPVLLQATATVWVIHNILRCHGLPSGPLATALHCGALGLLTGISWYTSQLLPDILVPLVTLSLWLLAADGRKLSRLNRSGLIALCLLGLLSHMSCMALAMGLVAVLFCIRGVSRWWKWSWTISIFPPAAVVAASLLLMPFLHLVLLGQGGFTPGGPVFIFGRLVQDGIAQRWLAEHCPAPGIKLCEMQDRIPHTADEFLWRGDSPFHEMGGWEGGGDAEIRYLVRASIKAYPYDFIRTSLRATAEQMVMVATGDGLDEFHAAARGIFVDLNARTRTSLNAARQQRGQITQPLFDGLNLIHRPIAYLSMLGLLIIMGWGWYKKRYDVTALAFFVFLSLLGNAFICGALSNPHDRYQSRLTWIATLVCTMAISWQWQLRKLQASEHSKEYAHRSGREN